MKIFGKEKKDSLKEKKLKNIINIKNIKTIKTIMIVSIIVASCLLFLNNSLASTDVMDLKKVSAFNIASKAIQLILYVIRFIFLILAISAYTLISIIFAGEFVSVDQIFFGKISFLNLDFLLKAQGGKMNVTYADTISRVYWMIFYLVIGIHFLLLIIGSIRSMLEMQTADKKAQNKELLTSWLKGMVMLFSVIFIAFTMLYVNDYICKALDTALQNVKGLSGNFILDLAARSIKGIGLDANIAFMFAIASMVITSIMFFYYVRRAVKVGYLIMIAPIVSLTYVTGGLNGKSNAYGKWIKEYSSNIFIQLFHILIYVSLILPMSSLGQIEKETNIIKFVPTLLLVFFGLGFIYNAEKLIKKLFSEHISKAEDSKASLASALAVKKLAKQTYGIAKKGKEEVDKNRTGDIKLKDNGESNKKADDDKNKDRSVNANENENESINVDTSDNANENIDSENNNYNNEIENVPEVNSSEINSPDEEINIDDLENAGVKLSTFDKIKIAAKRSSAKKSKKLSGTKNIRKKKEKKGIKKRLKGVAISVGKLGLKVGGAYTGAIIGQAANQEMFVGATVGAISGYTATNKALESASNYRGLTAKQKNDNYRNSLRATARQQVKNVDRAGQIGTYDKNGKLKSFNTDTRTEEGTRNAREYYKEIIKKQNTIDSKTGFSKLDMEYKKAYTEYVKNVAKERKLSAEEAAKAADQLIDYILSDKKLIIKYLNEKERNFVKAINDQQIAMDMQAFMQYTKPLEDNKKVQMQENVLTDIEGTDLGAVEDMITLLGEAKEEVSGKLEELGENNESNLNTKDNIDLRKEMDNEYKEVMPKKLRDNPRYNYTYYDYLDEEDEENKDEKNK